MHIIEAHVSAPPINHSHVPLTVQLTALPCHQGDATAHPGFAHLVEHRRHHAASGARNCRQQDHEQHRHCLQPRPLTSAARFIGGARSHASIRGRTACL